jgi:hypothetical protein
VNLPWTNSWFQLALIVTVVSGGLLIFDLRKSGGTGKSDQPEASAPNTPPSSQPDNSTPSPPTTPSGGSITVFAPMFFYQAPDGWRLFNEPNNSIPVALGEQSGNFIENLTAEAKTSNLPLNQYTSEQIGDLSRMAKVSNLHVARQTPFATDSGLIGISVNVTCTMQGRDVFDSLYFFEIGKWKVILVGQCLISKAQAMAPIFDQAARSLSANAH